MPEQKTTKKTLQQAGVTTAFCKKFIRCGEIVPNQAIVNWAQSRYNV